MLIKDKPLSSSLEGYFIWCSYIQLRFILWVKHFIELFLKHSEWVTQKNMGNQSDCNLTKKILSFSPNYFLKTSFTGGIIYTFKNASILSEGEKSKKDQILESIKTKKKKQVQVLKNTCMHLLFFSSDHELVTVPLGWSSGRIWEPLFQEGLRMGNSSQNSLGEEKSFSLYPSRFLAETSLPPLKARVTGEKTILFL